MAEGDSADALDKKKAHRDRLSGRKAEKKKNKKNAQNPVQELTDRQRNPKAFAIKSAVRAERRFRRKQDIETKKQHIPVIDRTPVEPPPILIAVVGPPKVGKSTLINNLIKLFTKSPLTDIKGPVTIVTGKKRRITLIECNNDINCMIDLAKVADLVLLLCDASFGFEMEVFEFLNICQVHGMPRIMGVLTHLDTIKNSKTLKTTKKTLKHRFWTEVYAGAKLFYLSGILHGEYLRNEIKNLGRFISVIKFRPLTWRSTHSYLLGDRYEDITDQELVRQNPKCDRNVCLYGYVRGVPLNKNMSVHIAGMGDQKICDISYLPDPCALPDVIKKRSLVEKEKLIYAPFSGVGGIVYDKDAVYVELGGSHSHKIDMSDESKSMVTSLIDTKETLDMKMQHSELQIFTGGKKFTAKDVENKNRVRFDLQGDVKEEDKTVDSDLDEELNMLRHKEIEVWDSGRMRRKVVFEQSDDELLESKNNSDSESSGEKEDSPLYNALKSDKNKDVHEKVANTLKILNKPRKDFNFVEEQSDEEDTNEEQSGSDEEDQADESDASSMPDDVSLASNESLVGVSKMKKKKAKIVDVGDIPKKEIDKINTSRKANKNDQGNEIFDNQSDSNSSDDDTASNNDQNEDFIDGEENSDDENSNEDFSEDSEYNDNDDDTAVKWKENLAKKAKDAFVDRQLTTQNLMKLVYGVFDKNVLKTEAEDEDKSEENVADDIGGLFRVVSNEQQRKKREKDDMNSVEYTLFRPWDESPKDWLEPENKVLVENRFVTGKWKWSEDANELLRLDDFNENEGSDAESEVFGDFEDLETGEKVSATKTSKQAKPTKRKLEQDEIDNSASREELAEKKRKLKEKFDSEYDNSEKTSYYDDLKISAEKQSELNRSVFQDLAEDLRVQIEGYRAGMYVRIEFQNLPSEFISNFDPTYPIVIGSLNMGEENVGYVNVKIKKHRWYKKTLKTKDPLIVSLGWRRFQTVPLYSKLEDDLKYRYLKYTPEHLSCNAHFWGPITPQGTGFLALQNCEATPEVVKKLGFRIAATGSVQELDKSTKIMKKLKLIGYPMKIYKKTAFIKGMFNSALEVAKFEGAKIKTVSGVRGQIKKAVSKPEGCFRGTFEDKILLSDIVFCRTWYKVDVPQFYSPVTTLLLPPEKKNAWKGVRTTGEIKREKGLKNEPAFDSLYTEIKREPKVFKPLVIPRKLQRALPYRDKPKHPAVLSKQKQNIAKQRVAVVREPHEQKVSTMMKMLRASFEHKQTQLKDAMSQRVAKHKAMVEAEEADRTKKMKKEKKQALRLKSKAQSREERKANKR